MQKFISISNLIANAICQYKKRRNRKPPLLAYYHVIRCALMTQLARCFARARTCESDDVVCPFSTANGYRTLLHR